MHEDGDQVEMFARCPGRLCDRGMAVGLEDGNPQPAPFSRNASGSRETLGWWLATAMALLNMVSAKANTEPQCESNGQSMLPIAAHAVPFFIVLLCTLHMSHNTQYVCDLSRMHRRVVCFFWLSVLFALAVSSWYIATGKLDMFHLLLESGAGAASVALIFQLFNQWAPDTRRGHIIATWLRNGVERSWPYDEDALARIHNSLHKIRNLTVPYDEKALAKAALNIAPLKWQRDILGDKLWFEMREPGLDRNNWRGVDGIGGTALYNDVGHCIQAMHRHLPEEWLFVQDCIFPRLWMLESRKQDIETTVEAAMHPDVQPQIVQRFGCGRIWPLLCLLMPYIRHVLCTTDDYVPENDHDVHQCVPSLDESISPVGQVVFFLNIVILLLMATHAGAAHYVLGFFVALGHLSLSLLHGIPSLVLAVVLFAITCGRIAPPSRDASIEWSGITINRGADDGIDRHDEVLISLAMLHRKGNLTLHIRDVHRVKGRIVSRFGKLFMDQVRGALERAERKVSGERGAAAGSDRKDMDSIAVAELEDLRNRDDFDEDAHESLLSEVSKLVEKGTPMPPPCGQDAEGHREGQSGDGGTVSGKGRSPGKRP